MGKPFCIWCEVGNHRGCVKQARYLSAEGVVLEASCGCYPLHAHPGPITEPVPTEDPESQGDQARDQADREAVAQMVIKSTEAWDLVRLAESKGVAPTEAEDQETEGEHGQDQAEPDAEDSS